MIDCLEFRRRAGADPMAADPEMEAHARGCAACARHLGELRAMDDVIRRALAVDLPPRPAAAAATPAAAATAVAAAPARAGRSRLLAIAASLVAGIAVGLVLLVGAPRESIAREAIGHAAHEAEALRLTAPLAPGEVAAVLGPDGMRLRPGAGDVTYAMRCVYAGHVVPHLVVRAPEGAVTVLMLGHREVAAPLRLRDEGFEGVVLPAPRGSIAVVGRDVADVEGVARRVLDAVEWGG